MTKQYIKGVPELTGTLLYALVCTKVTSKQSPAYSKTDNDYNP